MDFTPLRELLAAKDWRAADEATADCMLSVMQGKLVSRWLEPENLENFPCEALQIIDQLWVQHSQGRFGFSVQTQIWIDCGRPTSYLSRAWNEFGVRVGWRSPDRALERNLEQQSALSEGAEFRWNQAILDMQLGWLSYDRLSFHESAPRGHLPLAGNRVAHRDGPLLVAGWQPFHDSESRCYRPRRPILFSRVETCQVPG